MKKLGSSFSRETLVYLENNCYGRASVYAKVDRKGERGVWLQSFDQHLASGTFVCAQFQYVQDTKRFMKTSNFAGKKQKNKENEETVIFSKAELPTFSLK